MKTFFSFIVGIALAGSVPTYSQSTQPEISIHLSEVSVSRQRVQFFGDDKKVDLPDSLQLLNMQSANLGQLLSVSSPVYIRNYGGAGSLSSISFRGTGSNHTAINWNGFQLNSTSSGDFDLSQLPVDAFESVAIVYGASASLYGSGTFGGAIDLTNKPDWNNRITVKVASEYGSFESYHNSLKIKVGTSKIQYQLSLFNQHAKNNFTFTDNLMFGSPKRTMEHNRFKNTGLIQALNINLPKRNRIDAGLWLQHKEKELPRPMGVQTPGTENQSDSTLKAYVNWNKLFDNSSLLIKTAYLGDYLHYTDKLTPDANILSIDSRIQSKRYLTEGNYRYYWLRHITFDVGYIFTHTLAEAKSYNKAETENWLAITQATKLEYNRLTTTLSAREDFITRIKTKPQFSGGFSYKLIPEQLLVRGSLSTRFRKPTFNERFWVPGGNPDLKPENGWGVDVGLEHTWKLSRQSELLSSVSSYSNRINDWIVWMPTNPAYAANYKQVWARGIEASTKWILQFSKGYIKPWVMYSYTLSTSTQTEDDNHNLLGKQLRYIPKHTGNAGISMLTGRFDITLNGNFVGQTYSTDDESSRPLDSWFVTNLYAGYTQPIGKFALRFNVRIQNLADHQYQVIQAYAVPGRAIFAGINLFFQK